jgi:hypothetical protein
MALERRATYEDLCALPEHVIGEILEGELIASPMPPVRHAHAVGAVLNSLGSRFHGEACELGPGGWWILSGSRSIYTTTSWFPTSPAGDVSP